MLVKVVLLRIHPHHARRPAFDLPCAGPNAKKRVRGIHLQAREIVPDGLLDHLTKGLHDSTRLDDDVRRLRII